MKNLRKYFWQLVSTLLALVAIFATYNVFFLSKPNKELQIVVESPVSLVDVKPEASQDIQVSYKGEPVNKVFLMQIQIVNSGNQPIAESDYSRPISFTLSPKYRLASATIASSEPTNIGMAISKSSEQEAIMSQTLLNPGDSVSVRFIIIGDENISLSNDFSVDGRIVGVKEIKQVSSSEQPKIWTNLLASVIGVLVALSVNIFSEVFFQRIKSYFRKKKETAQSQSETPK